MNSASPNRPADLPLPLPTHFSARESLNSHRTSTTSMQPLIPGSFVAMPMDQLGLPQNPSSTSRRMPQSFQRRFANLLRTLEGGAALLGAECRATISHAARTAAGSKYARPAVSLIALAGLGAAGYGSYLINRGIQIDNALDEYTQALSVDCEKLTEYRAYDLLDQCHPYANQYPIADLHANLLFNPEQANQVCLNFINGLPLDAAQKEAATQDCASTFGQPPHDIKAAIDDAKASCQTEINQADIDAASRSAALDKCVFKNGVNGTLENEIGAVGGYVESFHKTWCKSAIKNAQEQFDGEKHKLSSFPDILTSYYPDTPEFTDCDKAAHGFPEIRDAINTPAQEAARLRKGGGAALVSAGFVTTAIALCNLPRLRQRQDEPNQA